MSEESQIIIGRLKNHIDQIISKYELAISDNMALREELNNCKADIEEKNEKIKDLEKRIEEKQLAEAFVTSSQDVKEAKRKIGKIVREIDKCISMLND